MPCSLCAVRVLARPGSSSTKRSEDLPFIRVSGTEAEIFLPPNHKEGNKYPLLVYT